MARKKLDAAPVWSAPIGEGKQTLRLRIKVVTPLFGGGYEAKLVDETNPIRAAAVRGHLRHWWRATRGEADLFGREEALWGSDQQHGRIALKVQVDSKFPGTLLPCAEYTQRSRRNSRTGQQEMVYPSLPRFREGWPAYALQPFQGKTTAQEIQEYPAVALLGTVFTLEITFPHDAAEDVYAAVETWLTYGGLGARSRRGCGALAVEGTPTSRPWSVAHGLEALPDRHGLTVLPGSHRVLGGVKTGPDAAIQAWRDAVTIYQQFRQKEGFARNPGSEGRPGRSRWPEPETIRQITGQRHPNHQELQPPQRGFPRADLGLPIIFHFKDSDNRNPHSRYADPADCSLEGPNEGHRRFASPVITRPLAVGNGQFRPMVLVLNAPHAWQLGDLQFRSPGGDRPIDQRQIDVVGAKPQNGKPIREALLEYVAGQWRSDVERVR